MSLPSIQDQTESWDKWITEHVEQAKPNPASEYAAAWVLRQLKLRKQSILEIGCADGWMCNKLSAHGMVTGFDLPTSALERAAKRYPSIKFIGGDFVNHDFGAAKFDTIVCMQTLPHIADHVAFAKRVHSLLPLHGRLILTCQNRYVFERMLWVNSGNPGQIRKWPSAKELKALFKDGFSLVEFTTLYAGDGHKGILRLVNSPKIGRIVGELFHPTEIASFKERFGWGQFLAIMVEKR